MIEQKVKSLKIEERKMTINLVVIFYFLYFFVIFVFEDIIFNFESSLKILI
jgi:hypothetical protein